MTSNQLQFWRNVEEQRANRAQEQMIPSQIQRNLSASALDYANIDLNKAKTQAELYDALLKQFELGRQDIIKESMMADLLQKQYEAKLANAALQDYDDGTWKFLKGMQDAGTVIDALGFGLGFTI